MGLFDVPTSASGGLFTPELQRAAALQGLFAMGNSIGAASQPSPVPGVNPFATAGIGATKAYDDFLQKSLGMSLLGAQIGKAQSEATAKDRALKLLSSADGLQDTPQVRAALQSAGLDPDKVLPLRKFGYDNNGMPKPGFLEGLFQTKQAEGMGGVLPDVLKSAGGTRVVPTQDGGVVGYGPQFTPGGLQNIFRDVMGSGGMPPLGAPITGGQGGSPRGDGGMDDLTSPGGTMPTRAALPGAGNVPLQPTADTGGQSPYLRTLKPPSVNLQKQFELNTRPEEEFSKKRGGGFGEIYQNMVKRSMEIPGERGRMDRLEALLEQAYTGVGADAVQAAKRVAKVLNLDIGDPGPGEAANALSREMALQLRNPAGGAGMPGAMSDADREFLVSMTPNLTTTPEGRKLMLETRRSLLAHEDKVGKLAMDYVRKHKTRQLDEDFFLDVLPKWSEKNPVFTQEQRDRLQQIGAKADAGQKNDPLGIR